MNTCIVRPSASKGLSLWVWQPGHAPSWRVVHITSRPVVLPEYHKAHAVGRWLPRKQNRKSRSQPCAAAKAGTVALQRAQTNWDGAADSLQTDAEEHGPAFTATLRMLDWQRLCEDVAGFANTHCGKRSCRVLRIPATQAASELLLAETRAAEVMEYEYAAMLDFGGIQSQEAEAALTRATKGGMCSAQQLKGVATLVEGAKKLKRTIIACARGNDLLQPGSMLWPLVELVRHLDPPDWLAESILLKLDEDGRVKDSASEAVGRCRGRVSTLTARIAGVLKGMAGEASTQAGRQCLLVMAGGTLPKGVVLGSTAGGAMLYVEPSIVVGMNNELLAARGELRSAEEAVLLGLSMQLADAEDSVASCMAAVTALDTTAARARYGRWIQGVLPEFSAFQLATKPPPKSSRPKSSPGSALQDSDDQYLVRLRRLRHPLLLADYLRKLAQLQRVAQSRAPTGARLGTRKENVMGMGLSGAAAAAREAAAAAAAEAEAAAATLQPPVPIDILIRPETRVVVITGPNTGGKTAAMKALGLTLLMARAGLPVPALAPARLPPFSSVLADIGDEQSLTSSLSTFSGHLRRIAALRAEADGRALILLDELGTGTDPVEGAALGVALLRQLVRGGVGNGALTIATTHHSITTGLKYEDARFENASVEFDEEKLAPTYRMQWGVPGRSNALNIARRLGLDEDVVTAAAARLGSAAERASSLVAALEGERQAADAEEDVLLDTNSRIRAAQDEIAALSAALQREEGAAARSRAQQLAAVLEERGKKLALVARRKQQQEREREAKAQGQVAGVLKAVAAPKAAPWVPRVGETVMVRRLEKKAKVLEVAADGTMTLQVGMMRMRATTKELMRL